MNTCGTCRHFGPLINGGDWDDEKDDYVDNVRYHKCLYLEHLNDYRDVDGYHWKDNPKPAGVMDGSGYYAAMCVTEDFGCNQWASP